MKKNDTIQSMLIHLAQDAVLPSEIDLWPTLRAQLVAGTNVHERGKWRSIQSQRVQHIAYISLISVVLLIFAFATPQGRAFAQNLLKFFTRAENNTLPAQEDYKVPAEGPRILNVTEVQSLVGFDVLEPAVLPEDLTFQGASHTAETNTVTQQFGSSPEDIRLSIQQQPFTTIAACDLCGLVGASASVQIVQIGQGEAEYVEGVWELTANGPAWRDDPYLKTLRWQKDGMAFELIYMGSELKVDDLIVIAESLE